MNEETFVVTHDPVSCVINIEKAVNHLDGVESDSEPNH